MDKQLLFWFFVTEKQHSQTRKASAMELSPNQIDW